MNWFRRDGDTLIVSVHAAPGARRTGVQGLHGDALKIRVAAAPVDGAANEALQRYLAQCFDVPLRNVALIAGQSSRSKRFAIQGSTIDPASVLS